MEISKENDKQPNALMLGAFLTLVSIVIYLILSILGLISTDEISTVELTSCILPILSVGIHYGHKSGTLMRQKTRLLGVTIYFLLSVLYTVPLLEYSGIPIISMLFESATFSFIMAIVILMAFIISYFLFIWGEKVGIQSRENAQKKASK